MAWNRKAKRVPTLYICTCAWQQQLKRAWSRQIIQTHRQRGQGKVQMKVQIQAERTCCVHVCACNNILLDKWVNWFHPCKETHILYIHTHTHSNIVKYLFEYILKSNLFLWWQSWIFSSHYSNLHCHKLCFHLPVFIQILISHQKWVMKTPIFEREKIP